MLPLVGALRHNNYFLSLKLTECNGNQQVLLMIANVIRFNSTLTKLVLANIDSPNTFEVLGSSLINNPNHALKVFDFSRNKIPSTAIETISQALIQFKHALLELHLNQCQLSKKSLQILLTSFKKNYGMSIAIELLDLSHNRLGGRGSSWLGNWMNMIRTDSHLKHLLLANTSLVYIFIGRPLVHFTRIHSLDLSMNKLDLPSVQLLTLWIETCMELEYLNISNCGLNGEHAGKLLSVLLGNRNLKDVRVYLNKNEFRKEQDSEFIIEALRRGSNIHTLSLCQNKFKEKAFISIIDALQHHKSLSCLLLDQTYYGSNSQSIHQIIATALSLLINQNPNIKALSLSGSFQNIIPIFLDQLAPNAALEELDISNNQLRDLGASCIADNLRKNQHLRLLLLDDNAFTYSGYQAILQIFSVNKVLSQVPFPWKDYQKLLSKLSSDWQGKLRDLLTTIQKMCSMNQAKQVFHFQLINRNVFPFTLPTPCSVAPLATVPDVMPEEIEEDHQTLFTFGMDDSDEGETEIELLNLQENHKRMSVQHSTSVKKAKKKVVEDEDSDFSDDHCFSDDDDTPVPPSRDPTNPPLPARSIPSLPPRGEEENLTIGKGVTPPLPPRESENLTIGKGMPVPPREAENLTIGKGTTPNPPTPTLPPRDAGPAPLVLDQIILLPPRDAPLPSRDAAPPARPPPPIDPAFIEKQILLPSATDSKPLPTPPLPSRDPKPMPAIPGQSIPPIPPRDEVAIPARPMPKPQSNPVPPPPGPRPPPVAGTASKQKKKIKIEIPSTKDYVFSDSDMSSEEEVVEKDSKNKKLSIPNIDLASNCGSIGELLLQVMDRRSFIQDEKSGENSDSSSCDDDDDDSW